MESRRIAAAGALLLGMAAAGCGRPDDPEQIFASRCRAVAEDIAAEVPHIRRILDEQGPEELCECALDQDKQGLEPAEAAEAAASASSRDIETAITACRSEFADW